MKNILIVFILIQKFILNKKCVLNKTSSRNAYMSNMRTQSAYLIRSVYKTCVPIKKAKSVKILKSQAKLIIFMEETLYDWLLQNSNITSESFQIKVKILHKTLVKTLAKKINSWKSFFWNEFME